MGAHIEITPLGQSGFRFIFSGLTVYVDPYLSNSVEMLDAKDLVRQLEIPFFPNEIVDADFVVITHDHLDHCDPFTLPQISQASPQASFIGPFSVIELLRKWGIPDARLFLASEAGIKLGIDLEVFAIPAAHPEIQRDENGNLLAVGYLFNYASKKIYIAGDTFARQELIDKLKTFGVIDIAFLPVNEHNYFLAQRGILGNMSLREAFTLAEKVNARIVVPTHWDMFSINSVGLDEIRSVHSSMRCQAELLINPRIVNLGSPKASIIIRTLNEAKYLEELLIGIRNQLSNNMSYEVIIVDSGSTDLTLAIARRYGCRVLHIDRAEFSFGRSLNVGCEAASGDYLVIVSGHCVPANDYWLRNLCDPLINRVADYAYGRQVGGNDSYFSEKRIFAKYFPEYSSIPQEGFYCNNANAVLLKSTWQKYGFNEDLTGLEDMELAQRLVNDGLSIAYVASACVYHYHTETWRQVRRRFEREAMALRNIMPQVQISIFDTFRYILASIYKDLQFAPLFVGFFSFRQIILYRLNQYWGVYLGNHHHRQLSRSEKEKYFFPE
jgi:L-ascorbate metabolism protein UlaG (beta-lactamase superfamily)/glycosyltransferase involved in cell wall biosynthesis